MGEINNRKLMCLVTGRKLYATKEYFSSKVEKLGSEEAVHNTYVCKEAKDLIRKGYDVDKIREMLNVKMDSLSAVSEDIIDNIVNSKKRLFKRLSNFTSNNPILNTNTDEDVKKFIQSLIEDE
jgi:hypothetical protein